MASSTHWQRPPKRYPSTSSVGFRVSERKTTKVGTSNFQNGNWLKGQARPFPFFSSMGGVGRCHCRSGHVLGPPFSKPGGIGHPRGGAVCSEAVTRAHNIGVARQWISARSDDRLCEVQPHRRTLSYV